MKVKSENKEYLTSMRGTRGQVFCFPVAVCAMTPLMNMFCSLWWAWLKVLVADWLVANYGPRMVSQSTVGLFPIERQSNTVTNSKRLKNSNLLSDNVSILPSLPTMQIAESLRADKIFKEKESSFLAHEVKSFRAARFIITAIQKTCT